MILTEVPEKISATLDGNKLEVKDGKVTLPFSATAGFIAYTDGTAYYAEGDEVELSEDAEFTTVAIGAVSMQAGAGIRINVVTGIRFKTDVNLDAIADLIGLGATLEYGTLISTKDLIGSGELTFDSTFTKQNVKYVASLAQTYNVKGFVGSLAKIKEGNFNREFVGRGYVKVTLGDIQKVIYAENYASTARSVAYLATAVIEEAQDDASSSAAYLYANNKELIDKWAAAYVK